MTNKQGEDRFEGSAMERQERTASSYRPGGGFFEIRVKGQLDSKWSDWLEGLEMKLLDNGGMILWGPIVDQAALMGVLNKLNRLNLTILSINVVKRRNEK